MKISATIICKNEEECIQRCLDSLFLIDEIVVCDTGSTDKTMEILRNAQQSMPDGKLVIVEHPWDDHFAAARNACLKHATGDWCVIIDCDETLDMCAVQNLLDNIQRYPEAKTFRFLCTAEGHENNKHWMVRAHKREDGIFWKGRIHEALNHDDVIRAEGCGIHYGYSPAHALDPDRCLRLLKREHDDAVNAGREPEPRILYYLAREYWYLKDYQQAIFYFAGVGIAECHAAHQLLAGRQLQHACYHTVILGECSLWTGIKTAATRSDHDILQEHAIVQPRALLHHAINGKNQPDRRIEKCVVATMLRLHASLVLTRQSHQRI